MVGVIHPEKKKSTWTHYYKITLPKKQFLRIQFRKGGNNFVGDNTPSVYTRYDPDLFAVVGPTGKSISITTDRGRYYGFISDYKLKKGTYYIVVKRHWTPAEKKWATGLVYSLAWK